MFVRLVLLGDDPNLKLRLASARLHLHLHNLLAINHHVELTVPGGYLRGSE